MNLKRKRNSLMKMVIQLLLKNMDLSMKKRDTRKVVTRNMAIKKLVIIMIVMAKRSITRKDIIIRAIRVRNKILYRISIYSTILLRYYTTWLSIITHTGHKDEKGHDEHYGHKEHHGKKGGHKHHKKWGHKKSKH